VSFKKPSVKEQNMVIQSSITNARGNNWATLYPQQLKRILGSRRSRANNIRPVTTMVNICGRDCLIYIWPRLLFMLAPEKYTRSFPRSYVNRGKVTSWRLLVTPRSQRHLLWSRFPLSSLP
jgi:hypothetical protein